MRAYYFGWLEFSGHSLRDREEWHVQDGIIPWGERELDAKLCPGFLGNYETPDSAQVEGLAKLYHREGWTLVSFWDRSGDRRFASNSAFIIEGEHSFNQTVALAREAFPSIFARFTFEIRDSEGC